MIDPCTNYKEYFNERLRPWKLTTFMFGMLILIMGSLTMGCIDWDIPVSFIMGLLTYIFSPWCVMTIWKEMHKKKFSILKIISACLIAYFCFSGSWELYNCLRLGIDITYSIYWGNFFTSLPLFILLGIIWSYNQSLKTFIYEIKSAYKKQI